MYFKVVPGKNFKNYVVAEDVTTKEDFEIMELVKSVVSRSEYLPFIQSFNKTISYSYLIRDN